MPKTKTSRKRAMIKGGDRPAPDFDKLVKDHKDYKSEMINALNYTTYMFEMKDCKLFASEYAKEVLDISLTSIPDWEFRHLGAICWLLSNDVYFPDVEKYHTRIKELTIKYKKSDNDNTPKRVDLTTQRTDTVIAELEGIIDDCVLRKSNITNPRDVFKLIGTFNVPTVKEHFTKQLKDIEEGGEGYEDIDPACVSALKIILLQLDEEKAVVKEKKTKRVVRKAKQKKIVPAKMVRKLKYKRTDDEYKIKSVQATKIVTADALWVFNTKTRKMMHYVAIDKVGLLVKGTTIQNFDIDKSCEKKLRKPEEFLKELSSAGKVAQRTLLDNINAKGKAPNGRVNEHCVLVKVY